MQYQIIQATEQSKAGIKFYGEARELWRYKGPEAIISGPFETGKTLAALYKLHAALCKYPNARGLAVRGTYKSLVNSAVVTFDTKVLPFPPGHDRCPVVAFGGKKAEWYDYPNGSRLLLGGMDNPDKFLSAEFDIIYVNQAEEILLNDWELLTGRATGRAGNMPYAQVIGDCNPSYPLHWIKTRGSLKLFHSEHEDNPTLFDPNTGEILPQGIETMKRLDALTGVRHLRGRKGLWVQAEGAIYDNFNEKYNVTDEAEYNPDWPVRWGVDDGYVYGDGPGNSNYHPRVVLLCQPTPQGGINVFDEYVQAGALSEETLDEVLSDDYPYKRPELASVDSSATELRERIGRRGIAHSGATHRVAEGIKRVRALICDGNGMRMIKIHPRCRHTINEMQSYCYDMKSRRVDAGEPPPKKVDDHCPDALRYVAWEL